ncbi:MAG TPA: glycosyltransferase family 4 protein [Anaerolineae bacterium]|nr:glycosyltransferase family 4 protein [Anaerolineae bacterium]
MKILVGLTYYRPHISGLTIYSERLAKAFVKRGHDVTVLTSRFIPKLPTEEWMEGVRVVRAPVLMHVSKGVVMPTLGYIATKLVLEHDVIHLHLPQLDAAGLALRGRLLRKPTIITYHCDLKMPLGLLSWAANQAVHFMDNLAAIFTHRIVAYTEDYAKNSPYLSRYQHKLNVVSPPVELPFVSAKKIHEFAKKNNPNNYRPVIGMAARFATEKGVEVLLDALKRIIDRYPKVQVWFAGPHENIVGEEGYFKRLSPIIRALERKGSWHFLGVLSLQDMARFYPNLDVLAVPSLNSTEAFGLVQIEAMMNEIPCVASDLPGVRQPVIRHKMGKIVPIGDSKALADSIIEMVDNPSVYKANTLAIKKRYAPKSIAEEYEKLFIEIHDELI